MVGHHHKHTYLHQWGTYAFARHCAKLGIPFSDCYWMVFGVYPNEAQASKASAL